MQLKKQKEVEKEREKLLEMRAFEYQKNKAVSIEYSINNIIIKFECYNSVKCVDMYV